MSRIGRSIETESRLVFEKCGAEGNEGVLLLGTYSVSLGKGDHVLELDIGDG